MEGTLGRFISVAYSALPPASRAFSFNFLLLERPFDRFSEPSGRSRDEALAPWVPDLLAASEGVAMALGSSFGELEAFEEECLRWCLWGADRCCTFICAAKVLLVEAHDRQVQVLRRTSSLGPRHSILETQALCIGEFSDTRAKSMLRNRIGVEGR